MEEAKDRGWLAKSGHLTCLHMEGLEIAEDGPCAPRARMRRVFNAMVGAV